MSLEAGAGRIHQDRVLVEAGHHSFDVVAVECIKVALNQLFLGGHGIASD